MGWLWSSSSAPPAKFNLAKEPSSTPPAAATPTEADPSIQPSQTDIDTFLASLSSTTTSTPSPQTTTTSTSSSSFSSPMPSQETSIFHPTTLSCTSAFDQAFHCQLFGGQFINYYRYGSLRDCSGLWSNFWFCTRTNRGFMSDAERVRRVQERYREKEEIMRRQGSSEDFWEARGEEEVLAWARRQFVWDLRVWEGEGRAVLREGARVMD